MRIASADRRISQGIRESCHNISLPGRLLDMFTKRDRNESLPNKYWEIGRSGSPGELSIGSKIRGWIGLDDRFYQIPDAAPAKYIAVQLSDLPVSFVSRFASNNSKLSPRLTYSRLSTAYPLCLGVPTSSLFI
jgi:hypothetical protein